MAPECQRSCAGNSDMPKRRHQAALHLSENTEVFSLIRKGKNPMLRLLTPTNESSVCKAVEKKKYMLALLSHFKLHRDAVFDGRGIKSLASILFVVSGIL